MRCYPFLSGSNKIINKAIVKRLVGSGGERVWTSSPGGEVCADLNDYIGRSVFYTGDLDPKITRFCNAYLGEGDCAVDVGANIGIVTLAMAKSVGRGGVVFAYEPNPMLYNRLSKAVEKAGYQHVTPKMLALGETCGVLQLFIPGGNAGAASLKRHRSLDGAETVEVPIETFDREKASFGVAPNLVKLDVEGFEAEVLNGMVSLLSDSPPGAIIFEANADPDSGEIDPLPFRILLKYNYRIFAFRSTLFRLALDEVRFIDGRPDRGHDFVALHAGGGLEDAEKRLVGRATLNKIDG